jgi:hypothetical protein
MHPCRVCLTLDGDSTPKASAKWCGKCGTFICAECKPNLLRRGMALAIIATNKKRRKELAEERRARKDAVAQQQH